MELLNRSATVNRSLLNELELSADFRTTSGLSGTYMNVKILWKCPQHNILIFTHFFLSIAASSGIGAEEDEIECDEPLPSSSAHVKEVKFYKKYNFSYRAE